MTKYKLSEISEIKNGKKIRSREGSIPIYGSNGQIGVTNQANSPKNSIIIGRVGANVGSVFFSENQSWISDNAMYLSSDTNKVDSIYLFYYLKNLDLNRLAHGSAQPLINQKILNNLELDLPCLKDQKKTSTRIALFDKKIELNNKINANLFDLAQTIFEKKFSYEGKIPLSNYFLPKRGKNLLKRDVIDGSVPVVAGGLKPAAYHNSSNTKAPVITISASGANAGYVQIWGKNVWSSDSSYIDSSVSQNIYFWFLFLKSKQKQIFDSQTGSAQPHIYPKHVGNILVPVLHENEVRNFNKMLIPIFQRIFQNEDENLNLQNIKTNLLDRYFS